MAKLRTKLDTALFQGREIEKKSFSLRKISIKKCNIRHYKSQDSSSFQKLFKIKETSATKIINSPFRCIFRNRVI